MYFILSPPPVGTSWIHAPLDVALLLREVIGDEAFDDIEVSMRSVSGWVYP